MRALRKGIRLILVPAALVIWIIGWALSAQPKKARTKTLTASARQNY